MDSIESDRAMHDKRYVRNHLRMVSAFVFALLAVLHVGIACADEIKIHRCIGANGEPTFSDRPCSTLELSSQAQVAAQASSIAPASVPIVTQTCPISPDDLRTRIAAAFATQNAVGISGLFLWEGYVRGSSTSALSSLAKLVREPLTGIDIDDNVDDADNSTQRYASKDPLPRSITVRTAREMDRVPREAATRFDLTSRQGCWWLLFTE